MDNPEAIFYHTNLETLEKETTLKAPYYVPSSQTHLESADESHIFAPESRKEKKIKSKLEYQPINYSHLEEFHNNSEKLKDRKYSASSRGDNKHQTEASESGESNTIDGLRDISNSLNGFDDSFASDTPISKRIERIHQRLSTDLHESFDLSLSIETGSENTSSFEFSSLDSNNSDVSANSSSDTSTFLSEKSSRMPQRSTPNVSTMLNRFRHGKPRPPTSRKATMGSNSNYRTSSVEETTAKLQTEEIEKKIISHEHPSQSKTLEERDLNRRMFDVEVDRLLQESAALSCGDVTSLPSSRVLPDPQDEKVASEQSYDRDLHSHKNPPATGSSRQNDDILYQWRLKRKLERAHTRADQKSMQATEVMGNSAKTSSSKCLCDDSSPATTKQVAEKPYAHQQENLRPMESEASNCYHHNPSACCACYHSHNNKHQVAPPPLIEPAEEESAVIEVASTQTQTGDSLLLAKEKPITTKSSTSRKSVKKKQKELAVQTDDDVPDSSNVSSQPDDVSVDDGSSFVIASASTSTNRRNRKGKGSTDPTVTSLTPTSKMMKKVVGNRLFEQTLDETKSQSMDLSSSRSLLTTSTRASNDQTSAFESHENSPQISNRSKDCEDLTLDMILKRVEDDDGDFDDDEVLSTLRSKRNDLIEQLRDVENMLDKHYRSC